MKVGVISDTHGLLRPAAIDALTGVEQILHAGDIGDGQVLEQLSQLAPVTAVRGNVDVGHPWAAELPDRVELQLINWRVLLLHDSNQASRDSLLGQIDLVISGHSHQPLWQQDERISWLNPGSAGRRRFSLPISLALVDLSEQNIRVEMIALPA